MFDVNPIRTNVNSLEGEHNAGIEFRTEFSNECVRVYLNAESREGEERKRNLTALADLDPRFELLPPSFVDYVSPRRPGSGLLRAKRIDDYIYAGEAARSSGGTRASDLVAKITGLRSLIASACEDNKVKSRLMSETDFILETLRDLTAKTNSAYLRSADGAINELRQHIGTMPGNDKSAQPEEMRIAWVETAQEH